MLLGVKLNLATFLPLLLGLLVLLAKKSTFLLKIALALSGVFGLGTSSLPQFGPAYGYKNQLYQQHHEPIFPQNDYKTFETSYHEHDEISEATNNQPLKNQEDKFYDYENNQLRKHKSLNSNSYKDVYWQTSH